MSKREWVHAGALCLLACSNEASAPAKGKSASSGDATQAGFYVVANATRTVNDPPRDLLPGFGFEIMQVSAVNGIQVATSRMGQWIPLTDLKRAKPSPFRGVRSPDPALRLAFVIRAQAPVRAQPSETAAIVSRLARLTVVPLLSRDGPVGFYATASGWLSAGDARVPSLSPPPTGVSDGETWVDIELASQTLVVYEGARPVFATLISGGVGAQGTAFATPIGLHRIVAKLRWATMDNLEHSNVVEYSYESVPFTQYIGRVALHGVFWHDDFGHPRSHGCINLSLSDAAYLFDLTTPKIAPGSDTARSERGTVVQVR